MDILTQLHDANIFSTEVKGNKVNFMESCDYCYEHALTKPELAQLISELQEICDGME